MTKTITQLFIIFYALVICSSILHAYHPLSIEESNIGDQFDTEIELFGENVKNGHSENSIGAAFKFALTGRWSIAGEIPFIWDNSNNGVGDASLSTLVNFLGNTENDLNLTAIGSIKSTSGEQSKGFGTGEIEYTAALHSSMRIYKFGYHAGIGYTFVNNSSDTFYAGLALEFFPVEQFGIIGEISGTWSNEDTGIHELRGLLGFTWELHKDIFFVGGYGFGISKNADADIITVGLRKEF